MSEYQPNHHLEPWDYENTKQAASYYEVEREDAVTAGDEDRAEFCRLMRREALRRLGMIAVDGESS